MCLLCFVLRGDTIFLLPRPLAKVFLTQMWSIFDALGHETRGVSSSEFERRPFCQSLLESRAHPSLPDAWINSAWIHVISSFSKLTAIIETETLYPLNTKSPFPFLQPWAIPYFTFCLWVWPLWTPRISEIHSICPTVTGFFNDHNVLKIPTCCSLYQNFLPF